MLILCRNPLDCLNMPTIIVRLDTTRRFLLINCIFDRRFLNCQEPPRGIGCDVRIRQKSDMCQSVSLEFFLDAMCESGMLRVTHWNAA